MNAFWYSVSELYQNFQEIGLKWRNVKDTILAKSQNN